MSRVGKVWICFIDPSAPFVYQIYGRFTGETIREIEAEIIDNWADEERSKWQDMGGVEFDVLWTDPEIQYGSGYGDVFRMEGYYSLTPTGQWERLEEYSL